MGACSIRSSDSGNPPQPTKTSTRSAAFCQYNYRGAFSALEASPMTKNPVPGVLRHIRRLGFLQEASGMNDSQVLELFLADRDDDAFEALVRRHGRMVFGVCRRLLRHQQDAEDAFQATFLVLARKAASIQPRARVGNWLSGVAYGQ